MPENSTIEQLEELADEITKSEFPFAKVKKIVKLDASISIVTPEAVKMLTKAAEMFMLELGKASYTQAVIDKRKTVQKKDIDYVVKHNGLFEQLDDLLDDWPEPVAHPRAKEVVSAEDHRETTSLIETNETLDETVDAYIEEENESME